MCWDRHRWWEGCSRDVPVLPLSWLPDVLRLRYTPAIMRMRLGSDPDRLRMGFWLAARCALAVSFGLGSLAYGQASAPVEPQMAAPQV